MNININELNKMNNKNINFEDITLRCEYSRRGGGIEIDLTSLGWDGVKMTAYQNYLGGGMLGSINNDCTISDWEDVDELCEIAEELRKYFHLLTNEDVDDYDEWASDDYDGIQSRASSAY